MAESIPVDLAEIRFEVARGRCECCKKDLSFSNRGRAGRGAWEAHHRFPDREVTLDNIRVVCTTVKNCHLNHCHLGDYWNVPVWRPCRRRKRKS